MPSIVPGYEYDIFISYRHNDNRSGWVTDFVSSLQEELAATIKEPLSIYFDKNPHDGLLETHSVDKSLEGKLKCLIFIPILSQTYCDPKSFAWQHEFVAFNKLAKGDQFGRDVKLSSGNVASRILPIKIHDLDAEDKSAIESEIGGALRAIDFIFKSLGVNRPLRASEEHPQDNLDKTFYRDQMNKMANAIKEIIAAIKNPSAQTQYSSFSSEPVASKSVNKKYILAGLALFIIGVVGFLLPKFVSIRASINETEKSVAVLAFADKSPNKDQEWFSDGLSLEILGTLSKMRGLKVIGSTSSFFFKEKNYSLDQIAAKLGVVHLVEGSVSRIGNTLRITATLIRTTDGVQLWSQRYDRNSDDLFQVQTDIAESITKALIKELSITDQGMLGFNKPANPKAYEFFLKGLYFHDKFRNHLADEDFTKAEVNLLEAIHLDPAYGAAYGELANLFDTYRFKDFNKYSAKRDSLAIIAYKLNPNSTSVLKVKMYCHSNLRAPNLDSAFYFLKKAYKLDPEDPWINKAAGDFYCFSAGLPDLGLKFFVRANERDPLSPTHLYLLGFCQFFLGDSDLAERTLQKVLELDPNNLQAVGMLVNIKIQRRDTVGLKKLIAKVKSLETPMTMTVTSAMESYSAVLKGTRKLDEAIRMSTSAYERFFIYYIGKDKKNMVIALDSAIQADPSISYLELSHNAFYNSLHDEPGFKKILESKKEKHEQLKFKFGKLDE